MTLKLGCIADDFTGATDLANNLVRQGMRVVQVLGVPTAKPGAGSDSGLTDDDGEVDAVVVALKSRTAPVEEAVTQSLAAARWLLAQGAPQLYFKVCSTFDSTPAGNIGPVAQALAALVQAPIVPVTPAFPENGRTVFKGHLFVGDLLLSDSPMRQHPLTPMTDANLVRVLQVQLRPAQGSTQVGLVAHETVSRGAAAVEQRLQRLRGQGCAMAIVDAIHDDDLRTLAEACRALPLWVAGSGVAIGIPTLHGLQPDAAAASLPPTSGACAVVSGSCSVATQAQVAHFIAAGGAAFAVDPLQLAAGADLVSQALAFATPRLGRQPVLVYATAPAAQVQAAQAQLGAQQAGALVETALAAIAVGLVRHGVGQLVVAGGETSGACVQALGIQRLRIGAQIDPGVPWCHAANALGAVDAAATADTTGVAGDVGSARGADAPGRRDLHLALKSGNFGGADFFNRAFSVLAAAPAAPAPHTAPVTRHTTP